MHIFRECKLRKTHGDEANHEEVLSTFQSHPGMQMRAANSFTKHITQQNLVL